MPLPARHTHTSTHVRRLVDPQQGERQQRSQSNSQTHTHTHTQRMNAINGTHQPYASLVPPHVNASQSIPLARNSSVSSTRCRLSTLKRASQLALRMLSSFNASLRSTDQTTGHVDRRPTSSEPCDGDASRENEKTMCACVSQWGRHWLSTSARCGVCVRVSPTNCALTAFKSCLVNELVRRAGLVGENTCP